MAIGDTDYASKLTIRDVVNIGGWTTHHEVVNPIGMQQQALWDVLHSCVYCFNALLTKVKTDGANSTYTTYAQDDLYTRGMTYNGIYQADLYTLLSDIQVDWMATLAAFDADTQITKTTYRATGTMTGSLPAVATGCGLGQDDIVTFLDDFVTKFNATLALLDTDAV